MRDDADDDDLVCIGMTIHTPAWVEEYDPGAPPGHGYACVCDRKRAEPYGPTVVPEHLLAEFVSLIRPPQVTICSAPGEDIEALKRLVEMCTSDASTGLIH